MEYTIYWLRKDLRLQDNLCLQKAMSLGLPILFLYVYHFQESEEEDYYAFEMADENRIGGASKWWLHHSVKSFSADLYAQTKAQLLIQKGDLSKIFTTLFSSSEHRVKNLVFSQQFGLWSVGEEEKLIDFCQKHQVQAHPINNSTLTDIAAADFRKKDDTFYKVYTPFRNHLMGEKRQLIRQNIVYDLANLQAMPIDYFKNVSIDALDLLPKNPNWAQKFHWEVGEKAAREKLNRFLAKDVQHYQTNRDIPALATGTSQLSPHLAFGEIAPWTIFQAVVQLDEQLKEEAQKKSQTQYLNELLWREFSYYLLHYVPTLPYQNFNPRFNRFPWENNAQLLALFTERKTGFPIIDAALEQLWQTGWMHNRLRMLVGSFLTKNLGIDWRYGATYFWDTLVDYDLASNSFGWQWIAGTGTDAAPYFRIFNPILQTQKFDPHCVFIKKYLPNLSTLSVKNLQALGEGEEMLPMSKRLSYPSPMINLQESRRKALEGFRGIV